MYRKTLNKQVEMSKLAPIMKETEELIAIIYKSIETAKSNIQKK